MELNEGQEGILGVVILFLLAFILTKLQEKYN